MHLGIKIYFLKSLPSNDSSFNTALTKVLLRMWIVVTTCRFQSSYYVLWAYSGPFPPCCKRTFLFSFSGGSHNMFKPNFKLLEKTSLWQKIERETNSKTCAIQHPRLTKWPIFQRFSKTENEKVHRCISKTKTWQ